MRVWRGLGGDEERRTDSFVGLVLLFTRDGAGCGGESGVRKVSGECMSNGAIRVWVREFPRLERYLEDSSEGLRYGCVLHVVDVDDFLKLVKSGLPYLHVPKVPHLS